MAGQLIVQTIFQCNGVTSVMFKASWNPPTNPAQGECRRSLSTKVTAADLPITATPPFLSGHTWCIVWRLRGALFFAHCTGHPMQTQNASFVRSNLKWKLHARGQQAHRATPWTWRLAIEWGNGKLLRVAWSSCWISTIPMSRWRLNGWFCPASSLNNLEN